MFLFAPSDVPSGQPVYLINGDVAVPLMDVQSIQGFIKVGVPKISLPSADVTWLSTKLAPMTTPDVPVEVQIDGGTPQTQLFQDDFDGGEDTTTVFDGPPLDGNA